MKRSYDIFVDNGLYVLGYYLEKDISEITYEDIENSLEMMCEKVAKHYTQSKILSCMLLNNPAYQSKTTEDRKAKLFDKFSWLISDQQSDYCVLCGEYHANAFSAEGIGRHYYPNINANTFANYSNNLHAVNMCPYCLILTTYSSLNAVKSYGEKSCGDIILYNSDSDEFLEDYTAQRQEEIERNLALEEIETDVKSNGNPLSMLEDLIKNTKIYDNRYIEQHSFFNGKGSPRINTINVNNKLIKIYKKAQNKSLISEMKSLGMTCDLIQDKLQYTYAYKIIDNDGNLKCTDSLLIFLNEGLNMLDKDTVNIITNMCVKLKEFMDFQKIKKNLKNIVSFIDYENYLIRLTEGFNEKTNDLLISPQDYLVLDDIKKYKKIINFMIINLI